MPAHSTENRWAEAHLTVWAAHVPKGRRGCPKPLAACPAARTPLEFHPYPGLATRRAPPHLLVMSKLSILEFPDPRLRTKAQPVTVFDAALKQLAADMLETMY